MKPTKIRNDVQGEFVAQLHPKAIDQLKGVKSGHLIIISHFVNGRIFQIPALLQENLAVEVDKINIDAKIRNAIGAPIGENISVSIKKEGLKQFKRIIVKLFGIQVNLARVKKATYSDMEINICRIRKEVMKSIGIDEGDIVIVESLTSSIKIRALELTEVIYNEKEKQHKDNPDQYIDCIKILGLERIEQTELDLPWILLDLDARIKLKVEECDPVRIYRSISHCISKRMHLISLPLVLTIMAAIVGFHISIPLKFIMLVLGISFVLLSNFIAIRKRIK